jgi:hypothetical protein
MSKLTPWFDTTQKPTRIGAYATKFRRRGIIVKGFSCWNGQRWGDTYDTILAAVRYNYPGEQNKQWRGLAKKP